MTSAPSLVEPATELSPQRGRGAANGLTVLYLCGWQIGDHGQGSVSFVYEQIEELSRYVSALYLRPTFAPWWRWPFMRARGAHVLPVQRLWPRGVGAWQVICPRVSNRLTRRGWLEDAWHAGGHLAREVRRLGRRIDLVHAHVTLPAGVFGASLARRLGAPLIIQEHKAPFEDLVKNERDARWMRKVLGCARRIVAVGPDLRERMRRFVPDGVDPIVIPEMVRTNLYRLRPPRPASETCRLVTVGGLEQRKDHATIVNAVSLLRQRGHKVELEVLGEGPERGNLEGLIRRHRLEDTVVLAGHQPRERVRDALESCDIYVHASIRETFCIAAAEALSMGRPVVTTRSGGPEEFVDEGSGVVVAPGDPDALAGGIRRVAERLDSYDREAMHDRIDRSYGPEVFARRVLSLYGEVAAETGRRC